MSSSIMASPIGRRDRDGFPPLGYLDLEKLKREPVGYTHNTPSTLNMPAPPLASPSTTYSGPPPPYSYPSSASSSAVGTNRGTPGGHLSGSYAPMRQSSIDEKDRAFHANNPSSKQTLPPITEALSIQSILTTNAPPRAPLPAPSPTSPTHRSNQDSATRYRANIPHQPSPRESKPPDMERPGLNSLCSPTANHTYSNFPFPNQTYSSIQDSQPPRTLPDLSSYSRPPASSLPQPSQLSPITTNPPPRTEPTSQSTPTYAYQPAYSYPSSTPGVTSYQAPVFSDFRNGINSDQERAEEIRKAMPKDSPPHRHAYGESVKRHLDIFDLETSLIEIAEGSSQAMEFARHYGTTSHQTQRSGPTPGSMPTILECDEILRQQTRVLQSIGRIKEVILKQQQALADQKKFDQQNFKSSPDGTEQDTHHFANQGEGAGGFAGPDAKKRRGRAAPPGRCHSCNRAETPEWRRGPDGARTLCNACGLHYAKVTRKMGNKAGAGGSNLRPKDDPSSP